MAENFKSPQESGEESPKPERVKLETMEFLKRWSDVLEDAASGNKEYLVEVPGGGEVLITHTGPREQDIASIQGAHSQAALETAETPADRVVKLWREARRACDDERPSLARGWTRFVELLRERCPADWECRTVPHFIGLVELRSRDTVWIVPNANTVDHGVRELFEGAKAIFDAPGDHLPKFDLKVPASTGPEEDVSALLRGKLVDRHVAIKKGRIALQ